MRAAVCKEYGDPDQLTIETVPAPVAGSGHVLIDVHAAAVNFTDLLILQNRYQLSATPPFIPGSEVAGVVGQIGSAVEGVRPGDLVCGQTLIGAFAEQVVLPAGSVTVLPSQTDPYTAAAFSVAYSTAYHALRSAAQLRRGETLLVLGAGGGIGLAAVDLGRALQARVIAAASTDDKLAICREYGASATVNYATEMLKDRVKALTDGGGVDVVIDPVGGPYAEAAVRATAWRGRYVSIGFAAGTIPRIPLNLLLLKGSQLMGFNIGLFAVREPAEAERNRRELLALFHAGTIRPRVAAVFALTDVAQALRLVAERQAIGKVIIDPRRR